jgi:hypothetical protein
MGVPAASSSPGVCCGFYATTPAVLARWAGVGPATCFFARAPWPQVLRGLRLPAPADGREYYPPMPKQDTHIFEVLISQMGECREIDPILGKTLCVLGHAELSEPIGNLLHGRKPRRDRAYSVSDQDI